MLLNGCFHIGPVTGLIFWKMAVLAWDEAKGHHSHLKANMTGQGHENIHLILFLLLTFLWQDLYHKILALLNPSVFMP